MTQAVEDFWFWHNTPIGSVRAYVCSWGWTGNGRPTVKQTGALDPYATTPTRDVASAFGVRPDMVQTRANRRNWKSRRSSDSPCREISRDGRLEIPACALFEV